MDYSILGLGNSSIHYKHVYAVVVEHSPYPLIKNPDVTVKISKGLAVVNSGRFVLQLE